MGKKLLFFIPTLENGAGMERISTSLANLLVEKGYIVRFVVLSRSIESFFSMDERISIVSLDGSDIQHKRWEAAKKLRQCVKDFRADYLINVDVSMIQVSLLAFPMLSGCKMITWEQFSIESNRSFLKKVQRLMAVVTSQMIVLTETDKNSYPKFLRKRIKVIPNFSSLNKKGEVSLLNNKTAIAVGRLSYEKGFDLLIEAWRKVNKDWQLRIIGKGDSRYLKKQIATFGLSDVVSLIPPTTDISKEYLNASLFILPSRFESFGLSMIEAMSFGLPVVAFNCPNGPKEIVRTGKNGVLVKNGNTEELAKAINGMFNNQILNSYGKTAREDFVKKWTEDSVLEKWEMVFK